MRCKNCHQQARPNPRIKNQNYCGQKECQERRKADWQRRRLKSDPEYAGRQKEAQKRWQQENPGYWQEYRAREKAYTEKNRERQKERDRKRSGRSAKMGASVTVDGRMDATLKKNVIIINCCDHSWPDLAKMDANLDKIYVKLVPYSGVGLGDDLAKMDASIYFCHIFSGNCVNLAKMDKIDIPVLPVQTGPNLNQREVKDENRKESVGARAGPQD